MPAFEHSRMLEDTRQTGVYRIRHKQTNKCYVGSTTHSFRVRWRLHRSLLNRGRHHSLLLQRAWTKYGPDAFAFEIVECTAPEHATAVEQTLIDFWKAADPKYGYNRATLATSTAGVSVSAETRAKMSAAHKGYVFTAEHRAKISAAKRLRDQAAGTKAKLSAIHSHRRPASEKPPKLRAAAVRKPRKLSAEGLARIAAANRSRVYSRESLEKMWSANRGRKHTAEARTKMSAAHSGRTQARSHVAKRSIRMAITKNAKSVAAWETWTEHQRRMYRYKHHGMTPHQVLAARQEIVNATA